MKKTATTTTVKKVEITKRALIQRVNRKLRDQKKILKVPRGTKIGLGPYIMLDTEWNSIIAVHVNLEKEARKLNAIQPWERLED